MAEQSITEKLALLRVPFEDHQISKLPKETKKQREDREKDMKLGVRCKVCGGWHHKDAVHLDYVGHAALTDRLLDADPLWQWEPVSLTPDGQPMFDRLGGLWINLTICGVTRKGYGHAEGKQGGDAIKEVIGDALRNAAMRFGAALDLWHKGDLHVEQAGPDSATLFLDKIVKEACEIKTLSDLATYYRDATKKKERSDILNKAQMATFNQAVADHKASLTPPPDENPFAEAAE